MVINIVEQSKAGKRLKSVLCVCVNIILNRVLSLIK